MSSVKQSIDLAHICLTSFKWSDHQRCSDAIRSFVGTEVCMSIFIPLQNVILAFDRGESGKHIIKKQSGPRYNLYRSSEYAHTF